MSTAVVIPMKPFALAKSRMAAAMTPPQRQRLVRALFLRTQRFFATQFPRMDRVVVTPCPAVQALCARVGATAILEPGLDGLDAAAARARGWATERGYGRMLLVPGDIPVWTRREVHALLAAGAAHEVVVARARDGGTNALLLALPNRMPFRYGPQSAARHAQAAADAGHSVAVCRLPFLAHDLDVPGDCLVLSADRRLPQVAP
ncbi:2-phospho-L-lactate guanylyltransferase [Pseudorhodoferax sp.]|uniref:2-phospho-L-lactate guanylyltransferase n=1 Tax=Pseudorhodoferax sp. TaxID=1993553 RepID=UPI002DD67196|nr:2-phospho-L-lactate guanylyltransferase [Pseudorhodoferax sp.]